MGFEVAQNLLDVLAQKATYNPDVEIDWEQLKYNAFMSSAMAAITGAPKLVNSYMDYSSYRRAQKDVNGRMHGEAEVGTPLNTQADADGLTLVPAQMNEDGTVTLPMWQSGDENVNSVDMSGDLLAQANGDVARQNQNISGIDLKNGDGRGIMDTVKPYTHNRPSYGKTQVNDVWHSNENPQTGTVRDPSGAEIVWDRNIPRKGQWDMGHVPGQKYSDVHNSYLKGQISLKEFLDWYRNPTNYRPELPSTNRSHRYE